MTSSDLRSIALAAQAEAPGPYTICWLNEEDTDDTGRGVNSIVDANGDDVVIADSGVYPPHGPVARHIAAWSPDVALEKLDRIAELEAALVEACDLWSDRDYDHLDAEERNALRAKAVPRG